jgi:hypothetical protein
MWIDLSLHAVPVLALLAGERVISLSTYIEQMLIRPLSPDFFLRERKYKPPVSTYGAVILAAFSALAYGAWAEYCASHNGTCKPSLASKVSWVFTDRFGETNLPPSPLPFLDHFSLAGASSDLRFRYGFRSVGLLGSQCYAQVIN